jgi:penicillin-binding protein 1A
MSLRDGLAYSKNTITAQLIQQVGPTKVAKLARAMGIRQSKLDAVPSLALGTSPVSLKEMVAAYGTIANGGGYLESVLVTRIEDRNGQLLEEFASAEPGSALSRRDAYTLLDAMRGVIDKGTGIAIRNHFGIRADVAGKTGTTQDNADGWFILMHPQLVAGAWVGFNDGRVTLRSDYWGQGAHSALPIVGNVFRNALRTRIIDPRIRFEVPEAGLIQRLYRGIKDWFLDLITPTLKPAQKPQQTPETIAPAEIAPSLPTEPDPLQEKIDQILEESRREEAVGDGNSK